MKEKLLAYYLKHRAESIVSCVVIVALLGAGSYLLLPRISKIKFQSPFPQKKVVKTQVTPVSPEQVVRQKNESIESEVGKQIQLPSGEEPIFATVSDRNQLQNQEFFKEAQDGDKILLYPLHKKAFLFRPSSNQVIAQAPLEYKDSSPDASVAGATTAPAPIRNGPVPTIKPNGKVLYNNQ